MNINENILKSFYENIVTKIVGGNKISEKISLGYTFGHDIIYKAENLLTGKVYIGQTECTLEERVSNHYKQMYKTMTNSSDFKYNDKAFSFELHNNEKETFIWEIIDRVTITSELDEREKYWISYYNSTDRKFGYNINSGGQGRVSPMYYDGSISDNNFWNNNIVYEEDIERYADMVAGQTKHIECPHCSNVREMKMDIIGTPSRETLKCPKCREYIYENFTDYFNKFKRS